MSDEVEEETLKLIETRTYRIECPNLPIAHEFMARAEQIAREAIARDFAITGFNVEQAEDRLKVTLMGTMPVKTCENCKSMMRPVGFLASSFPDRKGKPRLKLQSKKRPRLCEKCEREETFKELRMGDKINGL